MARVDPILQVVKSNQVIAIHSSILGDIVDWELRVGSHRMISFYRSGTYHVSGECWPYSRNGLWTCIWMHLNNASSRGNLEPQGYWVSVWHSQPHRTLPNVGEGLNIITLPSVFFINKDIYIISRTILVHIICWTSLEKKRRFLLSSLHSPPWALYYIIAALWVIPALEPPSSW